MIVYRNNSQYNQAVGYTLLFIGFAIVALVLAAALWPRVENVKDDGYRTPTDITESQAGCTEDMPCWDCTTMGNGICGRQP